MLPPRFRRPRFLVLAVLIAVTLTAVPAGIYMIRRAPVPQPLAFSEFLQLVEAGRVTRVTFDERSIDLVLRDGRTLQTVAPPEFLAANSSFINDLVKRNVRVEVNPIADPQSLSYGMIVTIAAFFALICFTVYRTTAGRIPNSGRARVAERGNSVITFQDVAGVDEAKDEVKEIVDFLRKPDRFTAVGGHIPKGVLLVGPPGTGKTLLARSIAGEAGVPFLFASGSDFVEMYAGVGAARVRRLFKDARKHKSCIVFIDELDAVGRSRGGNSLSHEEREQTLNQLLVEMDGFETNEGVIMIAATNRPDVLDPALLRAGRFDRRVVVPRPDVKGREGILNVHMRRVPLADDVDIELLARSTPGFSGADLENLVNEAALLAARSNKEKVGHNDFELAKDKVMMGSERRSMIISDEEKRNTAYHEAGHALVAKLIPGADPVHKVTIIPRGMALGLTQQVPADDRYTMSRERLENDLAIYFGGRAAEELVLGHTTTGAGNDLERATDLARKMVCEWGMSDKLGPMTFGNKEENIFLGRDFNTSQQFSERTAREIDEEVRGLIMRAYERAKSLLSSNLEALHRIAKALLDREVLDSAEIDEVLRPLLGAGGGGSVAAAS